MNDYSKVSHVGLDVHKNFSRVTSRDAANRVVCRERLEHADRQALRRRLLRWPKGTHMIVESSFGWEWMTDEIEAAGHQAHLASTRKVAAWREARGIAKSNRIDGDLLSELWPQQPRWWEVWLPPVEVRDQRELLRYRMGMVRMQTMVKNRIHAILHRYGILHGFSDLFGTAGRRWLQELGECDEPLRETARFVLKGQMAILAELRRHIAAVTRRLRRIVRRSPQGELWRTLPGISWVLAYTILAEVGEIDRFGDGRHLASYSLLVPVARDSGEEGGTALGRHLGYVGRRTLRWAFIEAAHGAVRRSPCFRAIFDARTDGGTKDRNRGYIAVGRKLLIVGAACVSKGVAYMEPQRPSRRRRRSAGRRQRPQASCPGSGQLDHPMAPAQKQPDARRPVPRKRSLPAAGR